jgi:hypothetical protein
MIEKKGEKKEMGFKHGRSPKKKLRRKKRGGKRREFGGGRGGFYIRR